MRRIDGFKLFHINERLHINKDIDEYTSKMYAHMKSKMKNSTNPNRFEFTFNDDIPSKLNMCEIKVKICKLPEGVSGRVNLLLCKNTDKGWKIVIELTQHFKLNILLHEMNHALRLTYMGKTKSINTLSYTNSRSRFPKNDNIDEFFYAIYMANDEEIASRLPEVHGDIKEFMTKFRMDKLSKKDFMYILEVTKAYNDAEFLIKFDCRKCLDLDEQKMNKFFVMLEDNASELSSIRKNMFSSDKSSPSLLTIFKLALKNFKDSMNINKFYIDNDIKKYSPKKGEKYYNNWIHSQGEKLKRKILSLYDHYEHE